jgi:hypothetical protein
VRARAPRRRGPIGGFGLNVRSIDDEYEFLRHQFPLVSRVSKKVFNGLIQCKRGPVTDLARQGVWPFTEYVKWHRFEMVLDPLHPYKHPKVTWLTDIAHPNIIPGAPGQVCMSLLGKGWTPRTTLAAVVNGLYFLLSDPNPDSTYPNPKCIHAARVCKYYGFPKREIPKKR